MADARSDEQKAKDCELTLTALADIRRDFEEDIDIITKYINHGRRKIKDTAHGKGKKTGIEVYDGTALSAKNILVDGMTGYLASRSSKWFKFTLPGILNFPRTSGMRAWNGKRMDEYPEVKQWLEQAEEVQYYAFHRSNFYDVFPEFISDGATAGTGHTEIEEDVRKGRIIFTVPHFREMYIAEDQFGQVDVRYRVYSLTLRQLADKFGVDVMEKAKVGFKTTLEKNPYSELEVIHAVYPRREYDSKRIDSRGLPVASLWVLRSPLKLLSESGYHEIPGTSWRWRKNSDEWYGRGPAWDAIVEVLTAQQMAKDNLDAGHRMARPSMVGPADLRGRVNTSPDGWTWVDDMERQRPMPLVTNIQLPFSKDALDRIDSGIKEHFHVNFFLMLYQASFNKVELTATQVIGMQGEQAAVLGTRVGHLKTEGLDPIVDRVFSIEYRAGRMPDVPMMMLELGVGGIEVDYLGVLAQIQQRLARTREINAGLEAAARVGQIFPESIDVVDGDQTMKEALEASGFPARCILPSEVVRSIREQRRQQQEMQQALEAVHVAGKAAPGLGKAPEEGSPIEGMASMMATGEE